ncbi:hypothetical protein [Teredinibacter turnerae]|uniref:hypothetical protein n=1 Tax=Teredinibacter turnerae TaxID=2426 RepID=UPI0005F7DF3A|nr:hypothetical protein [Teredinibacter turnerae]
MKKNCVLAPMRSQLLQSMLREVVGEHPGYTLLESSAKTDVAAVDSPKASLVHCDVLICELNNDALPALCEDVFRHNRDTMVIALINDGRQVAVFADDVDLEFIKCLLAHKCPQPGNRN